MMENMKCSGSANPRGGGITKRILLVQFMLSLCLFTSVASVASQNREVNLTFNEVSLSQALKSLSEAADCKFIFNYDDLNRYSVTAKLQGVSVTESLDILLKDKPFKYDREGEFIVISYNENSPKEEGYMVTGMVKDQQGEPLPGVTVIVKGSTVGTATTAEGKFELRVKEKNVMLVFSFVGMKTKEMMTDGDKPLEVVMEEEAEMLGEVVATGYQTISRERVTGSAVILNKEKLGKVQATDLTSKLEGITPGLMNYGGTMSIRGRSSFAVASTPLVVVDGQVTNLSLGALNPEDIESVTVLKDAAATSLYGIRASNGVIVVVTRKAVGKTTNVTASAGFYIYPLPKLSYLDYASTSDIIDFEREYLLKDPTYANSPSDYFANLVDPASPQRMTDIQRLYYEMSLGNLTATELEEKIDEMRKYDYRKERRKVLQQTAVTQDYSLSIAKGGENSNLFVSFRYQDYGQYVKSAESKRFSAYIKNEMDLNKWFKLTYGANVYFTRSKSSMAENSSNTDAPAVGYIMPYERLRDDDGNLVYHYFHNYYLSQKVNNTDGLKFMGYNAIESSTQNMSTTKDLYLKFFAHTDFRIMRGLDLGLKFQYERTYSETERYDEEDSYQMRYMINRYATINSSGDFVYNIPEGGHVKRDNSRGEYYNFRVQLNYQKTFGDDHDLSVLVGGEIRQDQSKSTGSEIYGYDKDKLTYSQVDWLSLSQDGVIGQLHSTATMKRSEYISSGDTKHRYVSAYANAGYTYLGRYTLNGNIRVDQADLFGTDPKYRYRPLWSVGASWNMMKEAFLSDVNYLDLLKVRVAYGITGNVDQTSSPYLLGAYMNSLWTNSNVTDIITPPNPRLRWEKTSSFNFGIDFSFFARWSGSLDFYRRYSSDLLAWRTLDPSLGFSSAKVNNGEMKNTGVEFSIAYDWLKKKDLSLNTMFTAAYNKNKIEEVGYIPSTASSMLRSPYSNYLKGDTYGTVYAYRYAGLTETGDPSVYDENGEVKSNTSVEDIQALVAKGQLAPKWNGALTVNLRWKTLEFFTKFVYYLGHSLRNDVPDLYSTYGDISGSMHKDMAKRWTLENTDTDIPSMEVNGLQVDRNLHWRYADVQVLSASFIKCRNIGVSYSLPNNWVKTLKLKEVKVRAQINNPFYWAKNNEGIDPEAFNANEGTRASQQRATYVLGLSVNF